MSVEDRIKETLRAIKATPNSGSEELRLEPSILDELRMRGYITAAVHTPLSGEQVFANIKITVPGELCLESLESPQPKEVKPVPHWYTNPILLAGLAFVSGVAVLGVGYFLGWN